MLNSGTPHGRKSCHGAILTSSSRKEHYIIPHNTTQSTQWQLNHVRANQGGESPSAANGQTYLHVVTSYPTLTITENNSKILENNVSLLQEAETQEIT